jgi:hypothetical protein
MIHSEFGYQTKIWPVYADVDGGNIDRAQSIDPAVTMNSEEVKECGRDSERDGVLGYDKGIPAVAYKVTQLDYSTLAIFKKLAGKADSVDSLTLNDFKTPASDITTLLTDDSGVVKGTYLYSELRLNSFAFNIGDPNARIERTFNLVGEAVKLTKVGAKYVIYKRAEVESGEEGDFDIVLTAPVPAINPDTSKYIERLVRVRAGVAEKLVEGTTDDTYAYVNGTTTLTVHGAEVGDAYRVCHFAAEHVTGVEPYEVNDDDPATMKAYHAEILVGTSQRLYRLQSISVDVTLDRSDEGAIGTKDKIGRGISKKTVKITLGEILDEFTVEDVIRGEVSGYTVMDVANLSDDITVMVKVFGDYPHETFAWGMKSTGMMPTDYSATASVENYVKKNVSLQGSALLLSETVGDIV